MSERPEPQLLMSASAQRFCPILMGPDTSQSTADQRLILYGASGLFIRSFSSHWRFVDLGDLVGFLSDWLQPGPFGRGTASIKCEQSDLQRIDLVPSAHTLHILRSPGRASLPISNSLFIVPVSHLYQH